ncbi:protein of unknown function [Actinopolyspora alba]|uniref:DUF1996 domain-containing protein n=1 Tax=Actinopolyspora alba TaxID=673379 RepID=A0A1I1UND8_9ACTN|nr:protein of unknown function [Actinopolyspora alba]
MVARFVAGFAFSCSVPGTRLFRSPAGSVLRSIVKPLCGGVATVVAAALLAAAPQAETSATPLVTHHEFQVDCSFSHRAKDDPIVFPGESGTSHDHTFPGNTGTDAESTTDSLSDAGVGSTTCLNPDDLSAYWFPTLYKNDEPIEPIGNG